MVGVRTYAQPLDPLDFASLGTLNLPAGDYTIDTDTLTIFDNTAPGVPLFSGVADDQGGQADYINGVWDPVANPGQLGIPEIAVFAFDGIDLQASSNVTITGRRAIALVSHGDATIATPLSVAGQDVPGNSTMPAPGGRGGAGGFDGALSPDVPAPRPQLPGQGPGGGLAYPDATGSVGTEFGGPGSFGGRGYVISPNGYDTPGSVYGDLTSVLQGGSGGANFTTAFGNQEGAGGGGAIEINAIGELSIDASVSARGGNGADALSRSGSGSGGGIRLVGERVALNAPVIAAGGGTSQPNGGGGRVYVAGLLDLTGVTIGEQALALTAAIDVKSNHANPDGTPTVGRSLANYGVITLSPATTLVGLGESITLGETNAVPTATENYEIVLRNTQFGLDATGVVGAAGHTNRYTIELAHETATLNGTGTLTNVSQLRGTGRVEVVMDNVAGGRIDAVNDTLIFTQAVTNASGAQINAINSTLSFDAGLNSVGDINLINSTVNGDVVNDGVASLAGTNTFTGTVSGNGTFTGTGTGAFAGVLSPGSSPGLLTFEGDLELESTATLEIEIGGTTPGTQHDRVEVGGFATLAGELDVTLIDGFVPEVGDNFGFLFASGCFDASFSAVNLPDLSSEGLDWQLNPGGATLFLEVVAGLDGDFDGDGDVDGSDFLTWQRDPSVGDLADWQANYGSPSSLAASSTVPEPSTFLLFALAGLCGVPFIRQR